MSFSFIASASDWVNIAPILVLAGMALLLLLADLLLPQGERARQTLENNPGLPFSFLVLPILAVLGLLGALAATIVLYFVGNHQTAFASMLASDQGTLYGFAIIIVAATLAVLLSPGYFKAQKLVDQGEYYALILLATIGMLILIASMSFLTVFVGIELLSLALYILCGYVARRPGSQEAGLKYFLLSSFASGFLLYGLALVYGATGKTQFTDVDHFVSVHGASILLYLGMDLLTVGFAFKVSLVPFQAWTPDVYEGAPAPITGFMSVATKAAALIAFARIFTIELNSAHNAWEPTLWAICVLTIVGGNLLAVSQKNVKRMLGYSSIAHAGYLMMGIIADNSLGLSAILFYLLCYGFLNLGAFGVVSVLEHVDGSGTGAADLRGLWKRQPVLAGTLAFFLFGLAGFPPMAGFAAKFYIFYAALASGHPELLVIGVVASILGMYYYLRPIATMFMEEPAPAPETAVPASPVPAEPVAPARTVGSRSSRAATALATRAVPATPRIPAPVVEPVEEPAAVVYWPTRLALGLAVLGTLLLGTVLPFWLIQIAQHAAGKMF